MPALQSPLKFGDGSIDLVDMAVERLLLVAERCLLLWLVGGLGAHDEESIGHGDQGHS